MIILFRGIPISYWTIISGFVSFFFVLLFGAASLHATGNLHEALILAHFFLVFFGWIGLVVLGAELQFYRAMTGIRKYEPEFANNAYLVSLLIGVIFLIIGALSIKAFILVGLLFYLIGLLIHMYWLIGLRFNKNYKFPLNYFFSGEFFQLFAILLLIGNYAFKSFNVSFVATVHVFTIGWLSLVLQGALIRAFPMFIGFGIHPKLKNYLGAHHVFSVISSLILLYGFFFDSALGYSLGGSLWLLSWIFVFVILGFSFKPRSGRKFIHGVTLFLMLPGLFWAAIGALLGMMSASGTSFGFEVKPVHVHLTLVAGIGLIMFGALHRITTFQVFTLLYTGRRKEVTVTESSLLYEDLMKSAVPIINLGPLVMVYGFIIDNSLVVLGGGGLLFIGLLFLAWIVFKNMVLYLREKKTALPYYLKSRETSS